VASGNGSAATDGRQALNKLSPDQETISPHRAGLRPAPTKLVRRHSHVHCAIAAAARKDAGKMPALHKPSAIKKRSARNGRV
jgi:hypothetical protein